MSRKTKKKLKAAFGDVAYCRWLEDRRFVPKVSIAQLLTCEAEHMLDEQVFIEINNGINGTNNN